MRLVLIGRGFTGEWILRACASSPGPRPRVWLEAKHRGRPAPLPLHYLDAPPAPPYALIYTRPPADDDDRFFERYGRLIAGARRAALVSTTGVYPAHVDDGRRPADGGLPLLDEDDWDLGRRPAPVQARRLALELRLERLLRERLTIVRSGGIYGPGRNYLEHFARDFARGNFPSHDTDRRSPTAPPAAAASGGRSPALDQRRFVARIHVADLARLCLAVCQGLADPPKRLHAVDNGELDQADVARSTARELRRRTAEGAPAITSDDGRFAAAFEDAARRLSALPRAGRRVLTRRRIVPLAHPDVVAAVFAAL